MSDSAPKGPDDGTATAGRLAPDLTDPNGRKLIGFFGGMANNTYTTASRLSEVGAPVRFIRDRIDRYAISQPCWEDCHIKLGHEELVQTSNWTNLDWDKLEKEAGWRPPAWLVDPLKSSDKADPVFPSRFGAKLRRRISNMYRMETADQVLAEMQRCDVLYVSNAHAMVLAMLSGRPYFVCPAGGEFMYATGQIRNAGGKLSKYHKNYKFAVRAAFGQARAIVTDAPYNTYRKLAGGWLNLFLYFRNAPIENLSIPHASRQRLSAPERRERLNSLLTGLELPEVRTDFAVFVPSRIDYHWKGQDRILAAIEDFAGADRFSFIFSGWGADYEDFVARCAARPNMIFLKHGLSKPYIYDFCRSVEFVIDQFTLGHSGSATREALSVGAPVMGWIDRASMPKSRQADVAPLIDARQPAEIKNQFQKIADGTTDLDQVSGQGLAWIDRFCAPDKIYEKLLHLM